MLDRRVSSILGLSYCENDVRVDAEPVNYKVVLLKYLVVLREDILNNRQQILLSDIGYIPLSDISRNRRVWKNIRGSYYTVQNC